MSDYKHDDWYCKPANEAEAKEIVERAVASGAVVCEKPGDPNIQGTFHWKRLNAWGVINGRTCTGDSGNIFGSSIEYTIEELRQKFPLPGGQVEEPKKWRGPEDGLPPVGIEVEIWQGDRWIGATTVGEFGSHRKCMVCAPNGGGFYGFYEDEIRPLRTERERWVEAASNGLGGDMSMLKHSEFILGQIYDAIQSGKLKAPTNEPG